MVAAHHSAAGRFDSQQLMELEGTVTKISWRNPHIYMSLEATDDSGGTAAWHLEGGSPNFLRRVGIPDDSVKVGDRIKVAGWPPQTSKKEMFVLNMLTPAGEEMLFTPLAQPVWTDKAVGDASVFFQAEGDPGRPELGLFRVWSYTFKSPVLFPESKAHLNVDVLSYPLTESARESVLAYQGTETDVTPYCAPKGMPLIMEQPFPIEFSQVDGNILLRAEEYDVVRKIHMDPDVDRSGRSPSQLGYSAGQWDGDTLVVRTTDISYPWFNQRGVPQSEDSVIVERFTPTDQGSRLDYVLTVTDAAIFTEPVTMEKFWVYLPDQTVQPFDCVAP